MLIHHREEWNTVMHDYAVSYPDCVMTEDYLSSDCGSTGWAYILFLSFSIISMYIFTAVFTGVVSDNFSYVYQIASNYSLVSREQIRKYPFFYCFTIYYHDLFLQPIILDHSFFFFFFCVMHIQESLGRHRFGAHRVHQRVRLHEILEGKTNFTCSRDNY